MVRFIVLHDRERYYYFPTMDGFSSWLKILALQKLDRIIDNEPGKTYTIYKSNR